MHKEFKNIIHQYSEDEFSLNRIIVSVFINSNSIRMMHNELIKSLLIDSTSDLYNHVVFSTETFTFDDVIEAFELAIPSAEKVINGAD